MKEYTLRTIDNNGEIIDESKLKLKEGNILIHKITKDIPLRDIAEAHDYFSEGLKRQPSLITLAPGVELQILEVK